MYVQKETVIVLPRELYYSYCMNRMRSLTFLNNKFFDVAKKKYIYIYICQCVAA